MSQHFIVAEVSKNWPQPRDSDELILAERFEMVINRNLARGYRLHSWRLDRHTDNEVLNETIIAVFEQAGPQE
jgi:hypothetical protein